jgi:hypothetical protein
MFPFLYYGRVFLDTLKGWILIQAFYNIKAHTFFPIHSCNLLVIDFFLSIIHKATTGIIIAAIINIIIICASVKKYVIEYQLL